jgi:PAS domain-containing protein
MDKHGRSESDDERTTVRLSRDLKKSMQEKAQAMGWSDRQFIENAVRGLVTELSLQKLVVPSEWSPSLAQRFLECLPTPVVIKATGDGGGRIVWCNFAYEDLTGLSRGAMLHRSVGELNVMDDRSAQRVEQDIRSMQGGLASEPVAFWEPLTLTRRRGRTSIFRAYRFLLQREGNPRMFLGDISFDWGRIRLGVSFPRIRHVEHRLGVSAVTKGVRDLFQPFLSACPVAVAIKDNDTKMIWCNAEYEAVVGRDLASMRGLRTVEILDVEDTDPLVQNEHTVLDTNQCLYAVDFQKDGKPRTSLRFPIVGDGGDTRLLGVVSAEFQQQDVGSHAVRQATTPAPAAPRGKRRK